MIIKNLRVQTFLENHNERKFNTGFSITEANNCLMEIYKNLFHKQISGEFEDEDIQKCASNLNQIKFADYCFKQRNKSMQNKYQQKFPFWIISKFLKILQESRIKVLMNNACNF